MNVPKYYAACFGKSTIAANDPDVALIKNISSTLVERGIAVVHGGYSGGAMGAVDEGAVNTAAKLNAPFPEIWSVGVTVDCFSEGYGLKTNGLSFPTRTVEERLAAMGQLANMYVVLPRGGLGTAHELVHFLSML